MLWLAAEAEVLAAMAYQEDPVVVEVTIQILQRVDLELQAKDIQAETDLLQQTMEPEVEEELEQ
jgi:hypothetical protein